MKVLIDLFCGYWRYDLIADGFQAVMRPLKRIEEAVTF
jgi:hypothetical protein